MSGKSKATSPEEFWNNVEQIYGEVPRIIRLLLTLNGFDSYLALKGVREQDLKDFFQSLELTVHETVASEYDSEEKLAIEQEILASCQIPSNFKLRPGHRNYILNLMKEVERMDVNEFFGKFSVLETVIVKPEPEVTPDYILPHDIGSIIVRKPLEKHEQLDLSQEDHGYSRDDGEMIEQEEFMVEEEYLTDETEMDSMIKLDYEVEQDLQSNKKRPRKKPAHMYNDEFISKAINPRRRRVTINKIYAPTDEGTRERFRDLVSQSMSCILPRDKLAQVENVEVQVEKETESSWAVFCPLCQSRIRLSVVYENNGRYCNYKRSNFERHLRFKHCKNSKSSDHNSILFEEVVEH